LRIVLLGGDVMGGLDVGGLGEEASDPKHSTHIRVSAKRVIGVPAAVVTKVLEDPTTYTDWVESLQRFDPQADSTYLAEIGYLEHRKTRHLRRVENGPNLVTWERVDEGSPERWELSAVPIESERTRMAFTWEKWGSGSVFGVSASSPLFKAALEVAARYSLKRLEEVCRIVAKKQ
jgi:hypothetical protein